MAHPIDLSQAEILLHDLTGSSEVVGLRHSQPGLTGEIYPSERYSLDAFVTDFISEYEVEPVFTEVVILVGDPRSEANQVHNEVLQVSGGLQAAQGDPVTTSQFDAVSNRLAEESSALHGSHDMTPAQVPFVPWSPGPITWTIGRTVGSQAVIQFATGYSNAEGHWSEDMPWDWGIEIEANQWNPNVGDLPGGAGRPDCTSDPTDHPDNDLGLFFDDFWAARHSLGNGGIDSWSVQTEAGVGIDHESIGFYWDWFDTFDECSRQTMAVGIAHPAEIPENIAGVQSFIVQMRAPLGWPTSSTFDALYQPVYNTCEYGLPISYAPSSWCMGLPPVPEWPDTTDTPVLIINRDRDLALPGCYQTYQSYEYDIAEVYELPLSAPECGVSPEP